MNKFLGCNFEYHLKNQEPILSNYLVGTINGNIQYLIYFTQN